MTDVLLKTLIENSTNIILTLLTTVSSAVLLRMNKTGQQIDKTERDVEEVKHHVNGSLSARLSAVTHNILAHIDTRLDILESRLHGVESRVKSVENADAFTLNAGTLNAERDSMDCAKPLDAKPLDAKPLDAKPSEE